MTARTGNDPPSLDDFAAGDTMKPGHRSRIDTQCPDDVRQQLLTSKVGHAQALRWLHSLGYEFATIQMLTHWRQRNGWARE